MKWFAFSVLAILLLVQFVPIVQAEDEAVTQVEINLQPAEYDETSTVINPMEPETLRYEKDTILAALPKVEGIYNGPYIESSCFQFAHVGGIFQITSNFSFEASNIMNGVSSFWLRVPVLHSEYQWWRVWCDWGYYNTVEEIGSVALDEEWNALLPWLNPEWDLMLQSPGDAFVYDPGNVWSTEATETYQMRCTDSGIYIRFDGIFKPNEQFTVSFTGKLYDDYSPTVFLTQERRDLSQPQKYRFFDIYQLLDAGGVIVDYGIKYDKYESIPLDPAWAFLFTSGLGKEGMTSYKLKFDGTSDDFIQWGGTPYRGSIVTNKITGFHQDHYLSFYMPFECDAVDTSSALLANNIIDWEVTLELYAGLGMPYFIHTIPYGGAPDPADTVIETFDVTTTGNFLLFSSPYYVHDFIGGPTPTFITVFITIHPKVPCNVILLGAELLEEHDAPAPYDMDTHWAYYIHDDEVAKWDTSLSVNAHVYPLFNAVCWTDGIWASVTPNELYWTYNFGWGMAYQFEGDTELYVFLDNGGEYYYNGSYQEWISEMSNPDQSIDSLSDLFWAIVSIGGAFVGFIWDGIQKVWNLVKGVGNWIWNTIMKVVGWLISVVKDIATKVSNIIEGMLYGLPILVVIFLVNYAGTMLYTGRIPKLGKERKLYRKAIKKPVKRVVKITKKQYAGYVSARTRRLKGMEEARASDYRQRFRQERQREKWRVGEKEYERRQEAVKRGEFYKRKGVNYGKYDEKTRRGKKVRWR